MALYRFVNISGLPRGFPAPIGRVLGAGKGITLDISAAELTDPELAKEVNAGKLFVERTEGLTPENMEVAVVSLIPDGSGGGEDPDPEPEPEPGTSSNVISNVRTSNYSLQPGESLQLQLDIPVGQWAVDLLAQTNNDGAGSDWSASLDFNSSQAAILGGVVGWTIMRSDGSLSAATGTTVSVGTNPSQTTVVRTRFIFEAYSNVSTTFVVAANSSASDTVLSGTGVVATYLGDTTGAPPGGGEA